MPPCICIIVKTKRGGQRGKMLYALMYFVLRISSDLEEYVFIILS